MNHNHQFTFNNVTIRPLSAQDIEHLREWRNDSSNTRFLRKLPYITKEMQETWFASYLGNADEMCFAIDEIKALHRIVGSLALYNFQDDQAEFGKILIGDPEAHGRNIGCHSIAALLHIAFSDLKLNKVILHVYTENHGAVHVYEKVGFQVADTHQADGMDEYLMEITKGEFYLEGGKINA